MSSTKSGSSASSTTLGSTQPLEGFMGNLSDIQEYRLKEVYLALYQAAGIAPTSLKVGIPKPATAAQPAAKPSKFSFRSAPAAPAKDATIEQSLQEFKTAVGDLSTEELHEVFRTTCRNDHPDLLVLRFLRARKWDVPKSLEQLGLTLRWRHKDWNIDTLLERGEEYYMDVEPDEGFINQYRDGKVTLHGHDKQGRPLVFIHVKKHDPKAQTTEAMERYTLHVIEGARFCLSKDVNTAAVVFDLGGFGLGNMDYHVVKFILTCFEKYYPECLGYLFIHRAPWVFSSVWSVIKGWIDPVVASKISFTKNEKDLLKFIDSDQLPKDLGGTSNFEYEWIPPAENESALVKDIDTRKQKLAERDNLFTKFDQATLDWIATPDNASSEKAREVRDRIFDDIYDQYWTLDPYIRARTIADRNGTFGEFKPQLKAGGVAQPIA